MTPLLAATATAEHGLTAKGWAVLVIAALLWLILYAAACAFWPYTACGRCEGNGKHRSPGKKHWRRCRRCNGSGAQIRTGRRIFNLLSTRRDVT